MTYTQIFGGSTIYPSDVSLLALTLAADVALSWPLENAAADYPAARIIDVTATGAFAVSLPDATLTGAGQTILLNNLSASTSSFAVKDFAGTTLASVAPGEQWQLYLASTTTAAGVWRVFRFGASTATVQPSALAGYGITTTSNTLSQSMPVATFNDTPRTALDTDRARALVWIGSGSGVLSLPTAAAVGNNFFVTTRNSGGGTLTLDPSGSELIDGDTSLILQPGDSATLATDGLGWYSVGLGQQAVFAFDFTSVVLSGGTYTLSGSELNRVAYRFTGELVSDATVIVPPTVQQYWVDNATTGPFTLTVKTSAGTGVAVTQGGRGIYYCDGTNFIDADTSTVALPVSAANGGTGQVSYTTGDLIYASAPTVLSKLSDVAVGNALLSGGVGVVPAWGKIGLTTHVSGTLPVANGGTGQTSYTDGQLLIGNTGTGGLDKAALTAGAGIAITNGAGGITIAATASGTVTSVQVSGSTTGLTFSGGPITTSGTITMGGTLAVGNGGTGQTSFTAGYILKGSGASPLASSTIYDAGSGVGIGTAAPAAALDVNTAGIRIAAGRVICTDSNTSNLTIYGGTDGNGANIEIYSSGGGVASGIVYDANEHRFRDVTATTTTLSISSTGALTSPPLADAAGYKGIPQNSQTAGYTLALTDMGKHISITTGGVAIPANGTTAFPIGATSVIYNNSGSSQTISITTDTLRQAGTANTGSRTLAQYGLATVVKVAATVWVISGAGVS